MKIKPVMFFVILIITVCLSVNSSDNDALKYENLKIIKQEKPLPLLLIKDNKIVNINGETIILKGLNICEPGTLYEENHWNENYFKEAASWGCRLVRVPVHPWAYRKYGETKYLSMLDQALDWSQMYGMYVIIDWHSIGNPIQQIFVEPKDAYKTDEKEIIEFWKTIASRYKNKTVAAFYEIFNEPSAISWLGGKLSWTDWRDMADRIIDEIYKINPNAIPIVGGLDFAYNLHFVLSEPLRNTGIVFAVHPYPGHARQPWEKEWDKAFGYLSDKYPMIFTEFGFDPDDKILPQVYKSDVDYGRRILDFAEKKGISWTAFVFYKGEYWPMPLFNNWNNFEPTISGAFFKNNLIENYNKLKVK